MSKKVVSTPNWSIVSRRSSVSPCQRYILAFSCLDCYRGQTFWEEGAKDTGSGRCNEIIKLLDQSEKGGDDGARFHDRPAAFWDKSVNGHETTGIYTPRFANLSTILNTETSAGLPGEIDVSLTCERSDSVTCNLSVTPR
jgi:hypothetical protein